MTLAELRAQRETLAKALRAILDKAKSENRDLSEDEDKEWRAKKAEADKVAAAIEREEAVESLEAAGNRSTRTAPPPREPPDPRAGLAPAVHTREERPYSILRLVDAQVSGRWADAKVEARIGDLLRERLGPPSESRAVHVPYRALLPLARQLELEKKDPLERHLSREHRVGLPPDLERRDVDSTTGASLIAVDLAVDDFIELLRNEAMVVRAGARMLPNLVGTLDIPRQNVAATGGWIATETGSPAESQLTTDKLTLTARTFGVRTEITRKMLKQATPGAEDLVREDIRQVIGLAIDQGAISGSGASGQPTGITVISGTGAVACAGVLTATLGNILEFESDVGTANALRGRLAWMMRSAARGALKATAKAANVAAGFLMEMDGSMNGYPSFVTEQAPASTGTGAILFGNWAEVLIGMWGVMDLFADPYTLGNSGGLVLRGFQDIDIGIRHAASFSRSTVF